MSCSGFHASSRHILIAFSATSFFLRITTILRVISFLRVTAILCVIAILHVTAILCAIAILRTIVL